jgi:hypothetical protein
MENGTREGLPSSQMQTPLMRCEHVDDDIQCRCRASRFSAHRRTSWDVALEVEGSAQ